MDTQGLIVVLLIGAVSGWLAGVLRQGFGFGLVGNIVVGILGSFLGRWLFHQLGIAIASGLLGSILVSVIGALVLLFIIGLIKK